MAEATSLADRILIGRRARGFSQAELARRSGIPQPQLSKLERGQVQQPGFADVVALAAALEIDLQAFASDSPDLYLRELRRLAASDETDILLVTREDEIRTIVRQGSVVFDMTTQEERRRSIEAFGALLDELDSGALDELAQWVKERKNIVIVGPVGSGKTSLLRTLAQNIGAAERVVVIEDTPELNLDRGHVSTFLTSSRSNGDAELSAADLIRFALRTRPDRLVVGEVRGQEAYAALQAWNSGHDGSFLTIHAQTAAAALDRLALYAGASGELDGQSARLLVGRAVDVVVALSSDKQIASICQALTDSDNRLVIRELYSRADGTLRRVAAPLQTERSFREISDRRPAPEMPKSGVVIGQSVLSGAPVIFNRFASSAHDPHMAILGTSGTGKSYFAKLELLRLCSLGAAVGVIDPVGEYRAIAASLPELTSFVYGIDGVVNPLDITLTGSVRSQISFVCEWLDAQLLGAGGSRLIDPIGRSLLAQALRETYKRYGYEVGETEAGAGMPLLSDLVKTLATIQRRMRDAAVQAHTRQLLAALEPLTAEGALSGLYDRQTSLPAGQLVAELSAVPEAQRTDISLLVLMAMRTRLLASTAAQKVIYADDSDGLLRNPRTSSLLEWLLRATSKERIGITFLAQSVDLTSRSVLRQLGTTILLKPHASDLHVLRELFALTEQEARRLLEQPAAVGLLIRTNGSAEFVQFALSSDSEHRLITTPNVRFLHTQGFDTLFPFSTGDDEDDDGLAGAPVRA